LLVRSRRPQELAKGIVTLLEDKQLRKELGELAVKKAKDEFTIEKTVSQIKKQYEDLINSFEGLDKTSTNLEEELEKKIKEVQKISLKDQRKEILPKKISEMISIQPEKTLNKYRITYKENSKKLIKKHHETMAPIEVNKNNTKSGDAIMTTYHILPPTKRNGKKVKQNPRKTEIKKGDDSEVLFSIEKLKEYTDEELNKHYKQLLYRQDDHCQQVVLAIHAELRERYEEIIKKVEEG